MKTCLTLIREPDGRTVMPPAEEIHQHQFNMKAWINDLQEKGHWEDGRPLSLIGTVLRSAETGVQIQEGPYQVNGLEIVGGYMLIKGNDLDEVVALLKTFPVFDVDGFVEIREVM